jgi:hypothetical protein
LYHGFILEPFSKAKESSMANLTIKGIDPDVLKVLKNEAERHRRSLNQEVIARLEANAISVPMDPDTFLARVRQVRVSPQRAPD